MVNCPTTWLGKGVVKGVANGPALLSTTPISFLGDIDIRSGRVVGKSSDLFGRCLAGTVLLVPSTRGSAGAWRFLYQLRQHGTNPVAIVSLDMPDPSVVQGAILSEIPMVVGVAENLWDDIEPGAHLSVDGMSGRICRVSST